MSISDRCETDKIGSLVERHVPKATLSQQQEAELTFTLPFESMDTFPGGAASNRLRLALLMVLVRRVFQQVCSRRLTVNRTWELPTTGFP